MNECKKHFKLASGFPFLADVNERVICDVFGGSEYAMIMNSDCRVGNCNNSLQWDFISKKNGIVHLVAINEKTSHGENPPTFVVAIVYPDTSTPCWYTLNSPEELTGEIWGHILKFIPPDVPGSVKISTKAPVEMDLYNYGLTLLYAIEDVTRKQRVTIGYPSNIYYVPKWRVYQEFLYRLPFNLYATANLNFLPAIADELKLGNVLIDPLSDGPSTSPVICLSKEYIERMGLIRRRFCGEDRNIRDEADPVRSGRMDELAEEWEVVTGPPAARAYEQGREGERNLLHSFCQSGIEKMNSMIRSETARDGQNSNVKPYYDRIAALTYMMDVLESGSHIPAEPSKEGEGS
jgi:hypothetical protein